MATKKKAAKKTTELDLVTTEKTVHNFTSVKHLANPGDCVAVMASLKKYWEVTGRKIVFLQQINTPAAYYQGAVHPTMDEQGVNVTFNMPMFEMMKPLMESQEYIQSMEVFRGQQVGLDFDVIRGKTFVNMPKMAIQSWIMFAYPDLAYDLSKSWIELNGKSPSHITKQVKGKIILNFTERYRNHVLNYFHLKNYAPDLIFAGTEKEHFLFCNRYELSIPRLEIKDFLEYAYAIKECRFLAGNQSLGWNMAEAMKKPRLLELCDYAPNCLPFIGEDSYGYYHQVANEYYFRALYNKTANK
jgi:hypothetical protein